MKKDQQIDEYIQAIKGLGNWESNIDFSADLFIRIKEKKTVRWMAAASILAFIFSGLMLTAYSKNKQEITKTKMEKMAEIYAVNTLNY
jgi:heme/copper-type cytochrome/quinol oxidase subunit 3